MNTLVGKCFVLVVAMMVSGAPTTVAPTTAAPPIPSSASVSLPTAADMTQEIAQDAIAAALEKSSNLKENMNICVVDKGANLVMFIRMDKSPLGSVDIAQKKAYTAVFFGQPTGNLGNYPIGPVVNLVNSNNGLITFGGGLPIKNDKGDLIGGVGVSGGTVEMDELVALAAVAAIR